MCAGLWSSGLRQQGRQAGGVFMEVAEGHRERLVSGSGTAFSAQHRTREERTRGGFWRLFGLGQVIRQVDHKRVPSLDAERWPCNSVTLRLMRLAVCVAGVAVDTRAAL